MHRRSAIKGSLIGIAGTVLVSPSSITTALDDFAPLKKMNNNTNDFHSFQSIELNALSTYSTSKIYYLRSKILSRSFLKKINSFFYKNRMFKDSNKRG
jgi:hypothetical protein